MADSTQEERDESYRQTVAELQAIFDQRLRLKAFAEWLVSLDDDDPNSPGRKDRQTVTLTQIVNRAKEALG